MVCGLLLLLTANGLAAQEATEVPAAPVIVTSEPFEVTFGAGPFDLLQPAEGLADLSSYRATLTVSFEGTNAGAAQAWARTYTLTVTGDPPARQLTIEGAGDEAGQIYMAEISGTHYEQQEGESCFGSPTQAGNTLAETWELAALLDSVIGADEAGSEAVNGIPSSHYTFNQSALGLSDRVEASGELWIASDGGYLVRYTLTTTGGAAYFGEGIDGTLTWDYQINDVGSPLVIELPADCPPAMLDFPMLPDAADVIQSPGVTSYNTLTNLDDTLAFYQEQVSALGGQPVDAPLFTHSAVFFGFTLDNQSILMVAKSDLAGTMIDLYQLSDSAPLAILAEVPDEGGSQPEPTAASSAIAACEPGTSSVPVTADATSIQDMGVAISYMTSMNITDITTFYEEQLTAIGAQVSPQGAASEFMAMLNVTQNNQSYMIMISPMGGTTNVAITSLTGQMTFTACTPEGAASAATEVPPDTAPATADEGCPRGVLPLMPDATDIQEVAALGAINYTTAASVPEVATFYKEKFAELDAQVFDQMPATDSMASPMFMIENQPIVVAITASGDGSTSVSISVMGGNPFRGAAPCANAP